MKYNYHTHTYRCSHATGTEEEYVVRAIENGICHMGFSDHVPFRYSDGFESSFRVPICQARDYISVLRKLRERYKEKIEIFIGFEMEYYPEHFEQMLKNVREWGAEYLILGQHYIGPEHPNGLPASLPTNDIRLLEAYVNLIVTGMETGVFTYVAHPDMFYFIGDEKVYEKEMRKICIAARRLTIPLEINFYGIRDKRNYPNEMFWKIAGQEQAPVTFGFDAHDAKSGYDGDSLDYAIRLVQNYQLNYIGKPQIVSLG